MTTGDRPSSATAVLGFSSVKSSRAAFQSARGNVRALRTHWGEELTRVCAQEENARGGRFASENETTVHLRDLAFLTVTESVVGRLSLELVARDQQHSHTE